MRELLWSKFWVGTLPLLILALLIVGVTDYLLQVSEFMMIVSVLSITLMTLAIAGLAVGFGTLFPQFETENAAQIPTSVGGLAFMRTSVTTLVLLIAVQARPVLHYLQGAQRDGATGPDVEMFVALGAVALLCILVTAIALRAGFRRVEQLEH